MRWVKLTLPPRPRARWLLITMRLSARAASPARPGRWSRSAPVSEASMFDTILAALRLGSAPSRLAGGRGWCGRRAPPDLWLAAGVTGAEYGRGRGSELRRPARVRGSEAARRGGSRGRALGSGRRLGLRRPVVGEEVMPRRDRRCSGRRGTAGTCPRRSTRWGRSRPTGCPASSSLGWSRQPSPFRARGVAAEGIGRRSWSAHEVRIKGYAAPARRLACSRSPQGRVGSTMRCPASW